ncbi:MAG: hypothetical protein Q9186_006551 [Xanthomendoza sp. 1 TL-2023]
MTSKYKSALLTTLFLFFTSISSLTLDIPPQMIANAISRSPSLHGPPIPYGYSMRIVQDSDKSLNADDLYICAIEAMYHWAANGYEDETQAHNGHSEIVRGLQISYHDIPERPINIYWKHLILAILIPVNSMDRSHAFTETVVEMMQHGKAFGIVKIGKPREIEASGSNHTTNNNSAAIAKRGDSNSMGVDNTKIATANSKPSSTSKTITDIDVPEVGTGTANITYQRFGTAVECKLLFSTALDGIAYAASDDWRDSWQFSTCYDWSKKMMYQTVEVTIGDGGSAWTADLIKRVARLLPQRLFLDNECGEVRFRMEIGGIGRVGTGSFQVLHFARQRAKGGGF